MRINLTLVGILSMMAPACSESYAAAGHSEEHGALASGGDHDDDHDGDDDHDEGPVNATPDQIAHVQVFESNEIGQATEVLGTVDVHMHQESEQQALTQMRARAAMLGADALVGVEFHHGESPGPTHLSGVAVRYRDLLHGRSYDVIAPLAVESEMGHDHNALERLRAQARALHADLILNIRFEHGDDPHGHPALHGDAVRFR
jgi:uncharacterized protein YbjQ (UPF0145 family)